MCESLIKVNFSDSKHIKLLQSGIKPFLVLVV